MLLSSIQEGGAGTYYINGIAVGTTNETDPTTGSNSLCIGQTCAGLYPFNGLIDDVRIYNRALSATDVANFAKFSGLKFDASQSGRDSLSDGLAGYWKLDEGTGTNATDASTNGNAGTLTNGPNWGTGKIGGAATLDGTDDYINLGTVSALNLAANNFSLCSWIKTSDTEGDIITNGTTVNGDYLLMTYLTKVRGHVWYGGNSNTIDSNAVVNDNTWHHACQVVDASNITLYVDGVFDKSQALSGSKTGLSVQDFIGARSATPSSSNFSGSIDEVRVYNRALTSEEITKLYKLTVPSDVDTRLKGYWNFDQRALVGTTAYDLSGSGSQGTLTNSPAKVTGPASQALNFNGTNQYIGSIPTTTFPTGSSALSMFAWIKTSTTSRETIVSYGNSAATQAASLTVNQLSGNGHFVVDFYSNYVDSNITVNDGSWHYVGFTIPGGSTSVTMYVDGVAVSGTVGSNPNIASSTNAQIGRWVTAGAGDTTAYYFSGKIDEVRIYNAALSATEIWNLYQQGKVTVDNAQSNGGSSLNDGLVSYWKLDDGSGTSATDSSGNSNSGTLTNGPTWGSGQIGGAVSFDGVDDQITSFSSPPSSTKFTVSAWVNIGGTNTGYRTIYADNNRGLWLLARKIDWYDATNLFTANTTLSTVVWHHILVTYNGSVVTAYLDGVSDGSASVSTSLPTAASLGIGGHAAEYFNGSIDEVRVYNRVLSSDEISKLYKTTAPTNPETGLIGYWPFNGTDISGTTTYDRSRSGNNGTLVNSPTRAVGKFSQALSFNGSNQTILMGSSVSLPMNSFSNTAWFKSTSSADAKIFSTGISYHPLQIYTGKLRICVNGCTAGTTTINDGAWHFAVVVGDNTSIRAYLDGNTSPEITQVATGTVMTGIPRIGAVGADAGATGASLFFPGLIDEVRIYNRALSTAEITTLYNFGR